jgi:hypothetical protein
MLKGYFSMAIDLQLLNTSALKSRVDEMRRYL